MLKLSITLKLFKNGKMVKGTDSSHRGVIAHYLRTTNFQNGYLRVRYGNNFHNDTEMAADKQTLLWALTNFTEKSLVDEIQRFKK